MRVPGCRLLLAWLLATALPLGASAQEWSPPPTPRADVDQRGVRTPKPPEDLLAINGALFGTLQWPVRSAVGRGSTFASGSLDVTLTVRPTDSIRIFLDVVGLAGQGPDQRLGTLSGLNKNTEDLNGKDETVRVLKLILRWSLDERFVLSVGQLDFEDYFDRNVLAEDEETQFLNASLVTNPLLKAPGNGPGIALRLNQGDWRYAFGVQGPDDVFGDLSGLPFIIAEVGRRNIFPLRGHYRWWARVSGTEDYRTRPSWATGVSIDQLVTENLGVFFRGGAGRGAGEHLTSWAWSAGIQLTSPWSWRPRDVVGLGYSEQREPAGRERVVEGYYRVVLADQLSLIANVQWIPTGVNTITGATIRNVVVPGLRALFTF